MAALLKSAGGDVAGVRISHPPPKEKMKNIDTDIEQILDDIEEAQGLHVDMNGMEESLDHLQSYVEGMIKHRDKGMPFTENDIERIGRIRTEIRALLMAFKEADDEEHGMGEQNV